LELFHIASIDTVSTPGHLIRILNTKIVDT